MLKFSTTVSSSWIAAVEVEKTTSSGLELFLKDVIPLNPLAQSTNATLVLLLYVITSSLIFNKP